MVLDNKKVYLFIRVFFARCVRVFKNKRKSLVRAYFSFFFVDVPEATITLVSSRSTDGNIENGPAVASPSNGFSQGDSATFVCKAKANPPTYSIKFLFNVSVIFFLLSFNLKFRLFFFFASFSGRNLLIKLWDLGLTILNWVIGHLKIGLP